MQPIDPDETDLLVRARDGDPVAMAVLYERHRPPALQLATLLAGPDGAEDLLAEAITRIVARLRTGEGPTSNFPGYLFATIRNRHRDLQRRGGHEEPASNRPWLLEDALAPVEDASGDLAGDEVAAAFRTLPAPWQRILRLLEIEELAVAEVAQRTGLAPAAVSSLAYRAREGLRTAYLDQYIHGVPGTTTECVWVRKRLSRYVRSGLSAPVTLRVAVHVDRCAPCATLRARLERVNRGFRFGRAVPDRVAHDLAPVAAHDRQVGRVPSSA